MDIKHLIESKPVGVLLVSLGALVAVLAIFQAGVYTGYRKAGLSLSMGQNYGRALEGRELPPAHGAAGRIVSVTFPTFLIAEPDGDERVIRLLDSTTLRYLHDSVASTSLKMGDFVVVIGKPNDSAQFEAALVRVLPPPPQ